jgi:hypothetical protein
MLIMEQFIVNTVVMIKLLISCQLIAKHITKIIYIKSYQIIKKIIIMFINMKKSNNLLTKRTSEVISM